MGSFSFILYDSKVLWYAISGYECNVIISRDCKNRFRNNMEELKMEKIMWVIFWLLLTIVFFILAVIANKFFPIELDDIFMNIFLICSALSLIIAIAVCGAWAHRCPKCNSYGMEYKYNDAKYCTECGYEFKTTLYCEEGHSNSSNNKFCSECGENLER